MKIFYWILRIITVLFGLLMITVLAAVNIDSIAQHRVGSASSFFWQAVVATFPIALMLPNNWTSRHKAWSIARLVFYLVGSILLIVFALTLDDAPRLQALGPLVGAFGFLLAGVLLALHVLSTTVYPDAY